MVPGLPRAGRPINKKFGAKPLSELFAPAISYAREGYPVPVNLEPQWEKDSQQYCRCPVQGTCASLLLVEYLYEGGRHPLPGR